MNFRKSSAASFTAPFLVIGTLFTAPAAVMAQPLGSNPAAEMPADLPALADTPALPAADDKVAVAPPALPPVAPPALPAEITPPPLPVMPAYYVGIDGQPVGPLDEAALRQKVAEGELTPASLVWTEGMTDWTKAAEVEDVAALITAASAEKAPLGAKAAEDKPAAKADTPVVPVPDAIAIVAGTWHIDALMPIEGIGIGDADVIQVFNPDGTFVVTGTVTAAMPGYGPAPVEMVIEIAGTWTATMQADGGIELAVIATTYFAVPALGIPPQSSNGSDRFVVRQIDADTLVDDDGIRWSRR